MITYWTALIALKILVSEIIPSLTFAALHFWGLGLTVKWKKLGIRELISECRSADIDYTSRSLNTKNHNELKNVFFYLQDPPPLLT